MTVAADPVEALLAKEERHDHALAGARGERLARLSETVVSRLQAHGLLSDRESAEGYVFHVLADELYGNAAIDIPATVRGGQ